MPTLTSAGVSVFVTDQSIYAAPNPTTIPLIVLATRANKPTPDGSATALGTTESEILRIITSQRELISTYGNPVFVTRDGVPVPGDESNEVGLMAAYSFLGISNRAFVIRADIDLGQILSNPTEPTFSPPDGTYWISQNQVLGGIFRLIGGNWTAVNFDVFTHTPAGLDGADDDWAYDYATMDGTLMFRFGGAWYPATTLNLANLYHANPLWVRASTPVGATNGDFWYNITLAGNGANLFLRKFRGADGVWISQVVTRAVTPPTPIRGVIWENLASLALNGSRPLYVGNGVAWVRVAPLFVQVNPPATSAATGTHWYNDVITDFALYYQNGSKLWTNVPTVIVSNPTGGLTPQKVIRASAPSLPGIGAIWVDVSTPLNLDNFPVLKQWTGVQWVDISASVLIQSADPNPTIVANGTFWVNTGQLITQNIVKTWNPQFQGLTVGTVAPNIGKTIPEIGNNWQPASGRAFGRLRQRIVIVESLREVVTANQDIRAEVNYYQLIATPGYPELYTEMQGLDVDIGEISFVLFDTPKFMIPSGVPVGREVTAREWVTDANNVASTGERGFSGSPYPYAACHYPWGVTTNPTDGNEVFVPPTHIALRTFAYSDSVSAPWFPPAGVARGRVDNVDRVGYLNDAGVYTPIKLNRPQRDLLYENKINPIAQIPNVGLVVYGQKTMSGVASALDRINVARLICKMKYDMQRLLEPFLFEINDAITRRSALIVTERYLAGLKALRALYDYAARCDEQNNTADRIDANQLWVDVAIKPAKAIEFIYVPIQILGTGDRFPF